LEKTYTVFIGISKVVDFVKVLHNRYLPGIEAHDVKLGMGELSPVKGIFGIRSIGMILYP
jgi:DNA-binding protein